MQALEARTGQRVPEESPNTLGAWLTPGRFSLVLGLLIFAAFPQVLLGLQTFVVRDYGFFCVSAREFSTGSCLAWRIAALESLQQLRSPFPGAMEHHAPLPTGAHLPAAAPQMVPQLLLFASPVLGGTGNVLPDEPLDGIAPGSSRGGRPFRL
jgi:hypothetical protein